MADAGAYRLEPGGVCYELVAGCAAIPAYLDALGDELGEGRAGAWRAIAAQEERLSARLLEGLAGMARVRVIGERCADRRVRVPTFSFVVEGMECSQVVAGLDPQGVALRFGDFYAKGLIEALGLRERGGVVRASMVHYNSEAEVDRFVAALARVVQ